MEQDVDSTPGNDIQSIPDEDDEAGFSLSTVVGLRANPNVNSTSPTLLAKSIYPNPAISEMTYAFESEQSFEGAITIWDANGKQLASRELRTVKGENQVSFDVSNWSTGMYILQMKRPNGTLVSEQFVVVQE